MQQVEPDVEKPTVDANELSTTGSSTANGEKKPESPKDESPLAEDKSVNKPPAPAAHSKGLEAFFIILALVLSMGLMSLDQVSSAA